MTQPLGEFAASVRTRIEREYRRRGDSLGWRLLYGPSRTLDGATMAFVGLNPGGRSVDPDHAEFASESGSAYILESWGGPPGRSVLQRQVQALFAMLGVPADAVLAGNLVPFRSPDWASLEDKSGALEFGAGIWTDILTRARPRLVVTMGAAPADLLARVLCGKYERKVPVGWGKVSAHRWNTELGHLVALPHLSRFSLIGRTESRAALEELFTGYLTNRPQRS